MVADIAGNSVPKPAPAVRQASSAQTDALATLTAISKRQKTEAENRLEQILGDMKSSKSKAAREAAQRKLAQIKAKLEALKLAAGSAAATGDARLAAKVARDIRDAARELSRALAAAGEGGGGGGVTAVPSVPAAPKTDAAASGGAAAAGAVAGTDGVPPAADGPQAGETTAAEARAEGREADGTKTAETKIKVGSGDDDLAALKSEATAIAKELKKIMRKLREVAMRQLDEKDRAEMDKMFRAADREIAGLDVAAMPTPGMVVNISA